MKLIQIVHKTTKKLIAMGNGKEILLFDHLLLVKPGCLESLEPRRSKGWEFNVRAGLLKRIHLLTRDNLKLPLKVYRCLLPAPWMPVALGRIVIPREEVVISVTDQSIPYNRQPINLLEVEIKSDEKNDEHHQRIDFLVSQVLVKIEERDQGRSILYKDKSDGRFWQYFEGAEGTFLENITSNQWAFSFIEQRELKKVSGGNVNPQEYLDSLQDDPHGDPCEVEDCKEPSVRYSSLCKYHHYESVMGTPFPRN